MKPVHWDPNMSFSDVKNSFRTNFEIDLIDVSNTWCQTFILMEDLRQQRKSRELFFLQKKEIMNQKVIWQLYCGKTIMFVTAPI